MAGRHRHSHVKPSDSSSACSKCCISTVTLASGLLHLQRARTSSTQLETTCQWLKVVTPRVPVIGLNGLTVESSETCTFQSSWATPRLVLLVVSGQVQGQCPSRCVHGSGKPVYGQGLGSASSEKGVHSGWQVYVYSCKQRHDFRVV